MKASLLSLLAMGLSASSLFSSTPILAKDTPSTFEELPQFATKQSVNIILYDEDGKIEKEFYADGLEVT
ncbi:hypothetical protein [Brevibacillus borstelensis]|uniref:hypothetical protein n=1 Tax=Brevibacillus borstelensis TaxID=45462 RepID=UPI0030C336B5